jgi:UDP-galactopyranose mutase
MHLVVGAGLSGATVARQLAEAGHTVKVIEKRAHLAGNCYDEINEHGIRVSRYGAHIFHTSSERVWEYVNRFAEWTSWHHEVLGRIPGRPLFPIPVNRETINLLCETDLVTDADTKEWLEAHTIPCEDPKTSEEVALARVGPALYDMIFLSYTIKRNADTSVIPIRHFPPTATRHLLLRCWRIQTLQLNSRCLMIL